MESEKIVDFDTEITFAREFYEQAIEGLEVEEYPPKPDEWLSIDKDRKLTTSWELKKAELIGLIEHKDTLPEQRELLKQFLSCTLSVYLDLMSSISLTFLHSKNSSDEEEEGGGQGQDAATN